MITFVALWNIREGVSVEEFERWYVDRHIPDARRIPGLVGYRTNRAIGEQGWYRMAELSFPDRETFDRAFASPEWKHALADAGNYITDHQRLLFETTVQRLEEPN
jgi:uncharacterized protein (TIGR02118 family)